jgi:cell fate (sporulation/competence/biofilm development) regulator YlbF (YheA/YmcA/DUF963 family)
VIDYISDIIAKRNSKKRFIFDHIFDGNNESTAESINVKDWQERMIVRICQTADPWEIRYLELQKFIEDNDRLPSGHNKQDLSEKQLGMFIYRQRVAYKGQGTYKITQERIDKLNTLKYWFWDSDELWNITFQELQKFIEDNDRLPSASKNNKNPAEKRLGVFIVVQRKAYKGQGRYKITQERITKLNQLKYWFWEQDLDAEWNHTFQELQKFIEDNNRLPSPNNKKDPAEKRLGQFISNQRAAHKGRDGKKINQERITKLNQLKYWFWEQDLVAEWNRTFQELQKFIEDNDRLPSPKNKQDPAEKRMGLFICVQRRAYKGQGRAKLTQERIDKLNTLKYWFWKR